MLPNQFTMRFPLRTVHIDSALGIGVSVRQWHGRFETSTRYPLINAGRCFFHVVVSPVAKKKLYWKPLALLKGGRVFRHPHQSEQERDFHPAEEFASGSNDARYVRAVRYALPNIVFL